MRPLRTPALCVLFVLLLGAPVWAQMTIIDNNGDLYQLPLDCSEVRSITFADGFAELRCSGQGNQGSGSGGGQSYTSNQGDNVFVPCGAMAFADGVVAFNMGSPSPGPANSAPERATGEPDYDNASNGFVSLGCGGMVTLAFTRVYLVDVPGPDLHIFEVGPAVEPSQVEISVDGRNWINLGRIEGGKASIDIAPFVQPGQRFSYVRIMDLRSHCEGQTPGADIDAVAAIGCTPVQ